MEALILGLLIAVSVGLIVYSLIPSQKERDEGQVMRRMAGKKTAGKDGGHKGKGKPSAAGNLVKRAAPILSKPVMPKTQQDRSRLRLRLANAGYRGEATPVAFLASKVLLAGILVVLGLMFGAGFGKETWHIAGCAAFLGGVGFWFPELWLRSAAKKRGEKLRQGLPDALDLMVICVEAGLGLDAALQRVAKELANVHPILCEEFSISTMETQMGVPRADALEGMAARGGLAELKSLVAVVNQAEKFGTSIAKTLRNQADALRVRRRLAAEERAQKTAVKLMLPLMLFIFPAIMVVLGGPAALKLARSFSSGAFGGSP